MFVATKALPLKSRAKHIWRIANLWWAMICVVWTAICSANTLIGKYGSDAFRKAWDAAWVTPKWGWQTGKAESMGTVGRQRSSGRAIQGRRAQQVRGGCGRWPGYVLR